MANCFYKGKEVRSRSDRDRELQLSWAHTVKHTDINFRVTDSVARVIQDSEIELINLITRWAWGLHRSQEAGKARVFYL